MDESLCCFRKKLNAFTCHNLKSNKQINIWFANYESIQGQDLYRAVAIKG